VLILETRNITSFITREAVNDKVIII